MCPILGVLLFSEMGNVCICIYTHSILFIHIYYMYIIHAFTSTFLHLSIKSWVHITSNSNPIPELLQFFSYSIFRILSSNSEKLGCHYPQYIYFLTQSYLCILNFLPCPPLSHKEVLLTLFRLWHVAGPTLLPHAPLMKMPSSSYWASVPDGRWPPLFYTDSLPIPIKFWHMVPGQQAPFSPHLGSQHLSVSYQLCLPT